MIKCPIWEEEAEEIASSFDGGKFNSARTGGYYRISGTAMALAASLNTIEKAKLRTWLVDQRLVGESAPLVREEQINWAKTAKPLTFQNKVDRFLQLIDRSNWSFNHQIFVRGYKLSENGINIYDVMSNCELYSHEELLPFLSAISELGYLIKSQEYLFKVSSKGYDRIDKIKAGGASTSRAFVAMWFSPTTEAAFKDGIKPAIEKAGYSAIRIDQKEHNNKIDDEIVAEIRSAKFVVADFTSGFIGEGVERRIESRGGVYYEAGFAQGLGTPVIWTVNLECINHVHFDTRQFSHIVRANPADLNQRLYNRIAATVGVIGG